MRAEPQQPAAAAPKADAPKADAPKADAGHLVGDFDGMGYRQLQASQNELMSQRQVIASRRQVLADGYERATGTNKSGMADRLVAMDRSIVQMETQIGAIGQRMAVLAPSTTQAAGVPVGRHWNDDDVAGLGFSVFFGTLLVTMFVMRGIARRSRRTQPAAASGPTASHDRLDRIEHAVDTIAVEMERVSENQRFMTRLLTETQLAGTIAAVRSSAEAAKSEAAGT